MSVYRSVTEMGELNLRMRDTVIKQNYHVHRKGNQVSIAYTPILLMITTLMPSDTQFA